MSRRFFAAIACLFALAWGAKGQTGTWSGSMSIQGTSLRIVFHLDAEPPCMDSPDQGVKGIPIQVEKSATGAVSIKIPSIGAAFEGQWTLHEILGTFKQMGVSLPLTLIPGEIRLRRPQTPRPPFPYTQEEVTFLGGDAVLKGTLVLPEGCSRSTPVLVMVTGSGLQNRDEEIFEHKPFAVIADALAREGIATLRYDDRGFGESSGDIVNCTTEDLKADALSGIRLLRERFDKVGVLGHSEGGTIALMLAAEGAAHFIVSLAGMVVSGAETLLAQNRLTLLGAGYPEDTVNSYCALLEKSFEALVQGTPLPKTDEYDLPAPLLQNYAGALMQLQSPYMKHFLSLDMRPLLGDIICPVMAVNGTKDVQVDFTANLEALRAGLPSLGNHCIEAVEGVNHLFQHCSSGAVSEYRELEESFAPEVLDKIAKWLKSL